MATHRAELDKLIAAMEARGSEITVVIDKDSGYIDSIVLEGQPMNPLVFAEAVRPIVRLKGARGY